MTRVLIVDDDQHLLRALRINLTARGYQVDTAADATTGLALASRQPPDLSIVDLTRHPDELVGQRQLLREVWGPRYETETNYLRVHLANLRRKLEPGPARPRYLITEPGVGYRFTR